MNIILAAKAKAALAKFIESVAKVPDTHYIDIQQMEIDTDTMQFTGSYMLIERPKDEAEEEWN